MKDRQSNAQPGPVLRARRSAMFIETWQRLGVHWGYERIDTVPYLEDAKDAKVLTLVVLPI